MPAHVIPFIAAIVAFFATFMIAVGGASLWVALPTPKGRTRQARQRHRFAGGPVAHVVTHRGS